MDTALFVDRAREDIGSLLGNPHDASLENASASEVLSRALRPGELRVGYWDVRRRDQLPDFLVIRDDELSDTNAWLSAFLPGLAPISQWCRVISTSTAARMAARLSASESLLPVGAWVGAILSEVSLSSGRHSGAKDAPGLVAISTPSYAAARSVAVWGSAAPLNEVATRFEDVSRRLGSGARAYEVKRLLPLWRLLQGGVTADKVASDREVMQPFMALRSQLNNVSGEKVSVRGHAKIIGDYFGVPEVEMCAIGTQSGRVAALDAVASKMLTGPRSVAIEPVLGFAASLIDPGVAVLPDLLRRYSDKAPLASVWTGAFAGFWSPVRVLSENGGLGRIVSKEIAKSSDLFDKPLADIAYDELTRWIGATGDNRPRIRGLNANYLNVEIVEGVSVPFGQGVEASRQSVPVVSTSPNSQRSLDLRRVEEAHSKYESGGNDRRESANQLILEDVVKRVAVLEKSVSQLTAKLAKGGSRPARKLS